MLNVKSSNLTCINIFQFIFKENHKFMCNVINKGTVKKSLKPTNSKFNIKKLKTCHKL